MVALVPLSISDRLGDLIHAIRGASEGISEGMVVRAILRDVKESGTNLTGSNTTRRPRGTSSAASRECGRSRSFVSWDGLLLRVRPNVRPLLRATGQKAGALCFGSSGSDSNHATSNVVRIFSRGIPLTPGLSPHFEKTAPSSSFVKSHRDGFVIISTKTIL